MESIQRRRARSPSPVYNLDAEDDTYEPYIPIDQRRKERLAKLSSLGVNNEKGSVKKAQDELDEREDAQREEEVRREKARKERTLLLEAQEVHLKKAAEGSSCWSCVSSIVVDIYFDNRLQENC